MNPVWIEPEWEAPSRVRALVSTRTGGVSTGSYASLNLGMRSGDDPASVAANRARLAEAVGLPAEPLWLHQLHGSRVIGAGEVAGGEPGADAAVTHLPERVLAVLTADCLPVLFATLDGSAIGIAHAGWRGLVAGVVEAALEAMPAPPGRVLAWLGPAICAGHYEVGVEVHDAFAGTPGAEQAFPPTRPGHWSCDLAALARARLAAAGAGAISGGGFCTHEDERFYSYRREGKTGRMASLIWLADSKAGRVRA